MINQDRWVCGRGDKNKNNKHSIKNKKHHHGTVTDHTKVKNQELERTSVVKHECRRATNSPQLNHCLWDQPQLARSLHRLGLPPLRLQRQKQKGDKWKGRNEYAVLHFSQVYRLSIQALQQVTRDVVNDERNSSWLLICMAEMDTSPFPESFVVASRHFWCRRYLKAILDNSATS